jgi:putative solute:sodium symporter small subunit
MKDALYCQVQSLQSDVLPASWGCFLAIRPMSGGLSTFLGGFGWRRAVMQLTDKHQEYWRKNLRLTSVLLGIWFVATFVVIWFARALNEITFFGFPFAFYMGAQGALIIYVLVIWYYARRMNQMDVDYGVHEGDD